MFLHTYVLRSCMPAHSHSSDTLPFTHMYTCPNTFMDASSILPLICIHTHHFHTHSEMLSLGVTNSYFHKLTPTHFHTSLIPTHTHIGSPLCLSSYNLRLTCTGVCTHTHTCLHFSVAHLEAKCTAQSEVGRPTSNMNELQQSGTLWTFGIFHSCSK